MTRNYNRTEILNFFELDENQKEQVISDFCLSTEDAEGEQYAEIQQGGTKIALPLCMFMRTENNDFTHGIYSNSYFSGYFLTLSRCGTSGVIAYKYF